MANRVTRRQFMTRTGLGLGGLALGPSILAACGGDDEESSGSGTLYFENWPEYIDAPDGDFNADGTTISNFEKETGIKVKYTEDFADNNAYFAKIQPQLSQGKPIAPDIIAPTFWLAGRLIQLGWVEKLPLKDVPNSSNLVETLQKPSWDPTGEYTLPWQSGMGGIAYNIDKTGREITSTEDLFDPAFKGQIGMLTEMRDTVGIVGMGMGLSVVEPKFSDFEPVFEKLQGAVDDGQIRAFSDNSYLKDLEQGNYTACIAWSGDVAQLALSNPSIKFVIPEQGGTLWSDTMVIPKGAGNVEAAAKWMDYVYDPKVAAQIAASVQYISPVQGVQDELRSMGGESATLADNVFMFPNEETLQRLQLWGNLSEDEEKLFDDAFAKVSGT